MKFSGIAAASSLATLAAATDAWYGAATSTSACSTVETATATAWYDGEHGHHHGGEHKSHWTTDAPSYTTEYYAPAKTHTVTVGGTTNGQPDGTPQFVFYPNNVDAKKGDIIELHFFAKNHTFTQSNFKTPCIANGGFDTGFNQATAETQNTGYGVVRSYEVHDDSKPLWFYCRQGENTPANHCGKGMVFGINTAGKMQDFINNAIAQNGTPGTPPPPAASPTKAYYGSPTYDAYKAKTTVKVGGGNKDAPVLKYDPPYVEKAYKGSEIDFDFLFKNHTLTESSFESPCSPLYGGVDTGFNQNNDAGTPGLFIRTLKIDDKKPRFFYCRQNGHCAKGMVFAVNVDEKTFAEYQMRAIATQPKIKGRTFM